MNSEVQEKPFGGCGIIPASAIILGGGKGRRIGGNKLFLSVDETLLIERVISRLSGWFNEIIIAVGSKDKETLENVLNPARKHPNLRIVVDAHPGNGPLEGLATGLENIRTEWAFAIGCDMPEVKEAVLRSMWRKREADSSIICARLNGFIEPLHAFYKTSCIPAIRSSLFLEKRKLTSFYADVNVTIVPEDSLRVLPGYRRSFRGINTPEELRNLINPRLP